MFLYVWSLRRRARASARLAYARMVARGLNGPVGLPRSPPLPVPQTPGAGLRSLGLRANGRAGPQWPSRAAAQPSVACPSDAGRGPPHAWLTREWSRGASMAQSLRSAFYSIPLAAGGGVRISRQALRTSVTESPLTFPPQSAMTAATPVTPTLFKPSPPVYAVFCRQRHHIIRQKCDHTR